MSKTITRITTHGRGGSTYSVGYYSVASITEEQVNGQMAPVTWYKVLFNDGRDVRVNGAFVEEVEYAKE